MAKIVNESMFDLPRGKPRPRQEKYPYDEWLDGKARLLTKGEDFDVSPRNASKSISMGIGNRGYLIRTRVMSETTLLIQVLLDTYDPELDKREK